MCKKWFQNKKKITLFTVQKVENLDNLLTVTTSKKQAIEFAHKNLKAEHLDHYTRWCDLHNQDADSKEAWDTYFEDCISIEEKSSYYVIPIVYDAEQVAAIIRMFTECRPIGCSFDLPLESAYFEDLDAQQVEKILDETFDEEVNINAV